MSAYERPINWNMSGKTKADHAADALRTENEELRAACSMALEALMSQTGSLSAAAEEAITKLQEVLK